jgi:hypothetical protein
LKREKQMKLPLRRADPNYYRPAFWGTMFKKLADAGGDPAAQVFPHLPRAARPEVTPKREPSGKGRASLAGKALSNAMQIATGGLLHPNLPSAMQGKPSKPKKGTR